MPSCSLILSFCSVLLALHVFSCLSDRNSTFELVTYNLGLVPGFIPHYKARKEASRPVLANLSADLLCLQELWLQQDILDMVHATKSQYPYYHSLVSIGTPGQPVPIPQSPPCQGGVFTAFLQCLNTSCRSLRSQLLPLSGCSIIFCGSYMSGLSQQCINCFSFSLKVLSSDMIDQRVQECSLTPTDNYASTHGLLLLSKHPLKNKTSHSYHSNLNYVELLTRGYLAAEVNGLGPIVCTHLTTALLSSYFGPPEFTTYEQLHENETQQLLHTFPANRDGTPPILIGDFNHGPQSVRLVAEFPASHEMMLQSGYSSPYMNEVGLCTWCSQNPLTGNTSKPSVVDHVYVTNETAVSVSGVKRILDNNAAVFGLPISDHYGVQLTYTFQSSTLEAPNIGRSLSVTVWVLITATILQWLM